MTDGRPIAIQGLAVVLTILMVVSGIAYPVMASTDAFGQQGDASATFDRGQSFQDSSLQSENSPQEPSGTASAGAASLSPNQIWLSECFGTVGDFRGSNTYAENQGVCVSGDVDRNGRDERFLLQGEVYVVPNQEWNDGDTLSGKDVTKGGSNNITSQLLGGAFFDKPIWLPDPRLEPGKYDIILDDDRNGKFESGVDTGIGLRQSPGIVVRSDISEHGISQEKVNAVKGRAQTHADELRSFGGLYTAIDEYQSWKKAADFLKNLMGAGTAGVIWQLLGQGYSWYTGNPVITSADDFINNHNDQVLKAAKRLKNSFTDPLARDYQDLADDPPDANYREPVTLDLERHTGQIEAGHEQVFRDFGVKYDYPYSPKGTSPVEARALSVANRRAEQAALVRAVRESREKFQGARNENSVKWAIIHAAELRRYSAMLETNLVETRDALRRYKQALIDADSNVEYNVTALENLQDRVRAEGLTQEELEALDLLGLNASEINGLIDAVVTTPIPDESYTAADLIDSRIATITETLPAIRNLTDDSVRLKSDLESNVTTVSEPSAEAGGPYSGAPGDAIQLDGADSTDEDSLTYRWDTDLDGEFDDATGPRPSISFDRPRDTVVGLKVTDVEGLMDIDYAPVSVSLGNQPPAITDFTPAETSLNISTTEEVAFAASASDPDGDSVTLEWYLDGELAGTGSTFTLSPAQDEPAIRIVRLRVADSNPLTPARFEKRLVRVPDATPDPEPIADAGGPYTAAVGGTVQLDATGSVDDQGLTYEWDLDDDGQFDDLTGGRPELSTERTLDAPIRLKVTDPDGNTDVDETTLTVTLRNEPPQITDFSPTEETLEVTTNESVTFSANASDPDGDPVTFEWYLDGQRAGTGSTFTLSPGADEPALRGVRLRVSDGNRHTSPKFEQRTVVVPDASSVPEPIADAGGPYTGGTGQTIQFDGTGSIDDQSLTYEWDTDLDGEFDDASGPTPAVTFAEPRDHDVGLKVTDEDGLTAIDYTSLSVTLDNQPPILTDFSPENPPTNITTDESLTFTAAATDPDGDPITYQWFVNGEEAGTGEEFTLSPAIDGAGGKSIRVRIQDSNPFTPDRFEERSVHVQHPDRDSDGYRADVDCDDSDPSVNPGMDEIVDNGKNDDCDPLTLDNGDVREVGKATGTEYITFWSGELRIFAHEDNTEVTLIDVATGVPLNFTLDSRVENETVSHLDNPFVLNSSEYFGGLGGRGGPNDEIQVRIITNDAAEGSNESKPVTVWTGSKLKVNDPDGPEPPGSGNPWASFIPAHDEDVASTGRELGRNFLGFTTRDLFVYAQNGRDRTNISIQDIANSDNDSDDSMRLGPSTTVAASKVIAVDLKEDVNTSVCRPKNVESCDFEVFSEEETVIAGHHSAQAPNNHNWSLSFAVDGQRVAHTREGSSDKTTYDSQGLSTVANPQNSFALDTSVEGDITDHWGDSSVVTLSAEDADNQTSAETFECTQADCTREFTLEESGQVLVMATISGEHGKNADANYELRVNNGLIAAGVESSSDSTTSDSVTLAGVSRAKEGTNSLHLSGKQPRDARIHLTVVKLRQYADDVHIKTCEEGFDKCDFDVDTDGGKTWYLATTNVKAGNNNDVSMELRVDGESIAGTNEGSSDRHTWDSHFMTGLVDSDGTDEVDAHNGTANWIREWHQPETPLTYSDEDIEIYELHRFEDDTIRLESNTDISVMATYSPRRANNWAVSLPSYSAGDEGIELGTEYYSLVEKTITVFPTEDDTNVTVTNLGDPNDTRSVTLENGDLGESYDIYTTSDSIDKERSSSPDVNIVTGEPFHSDFVKVEADKPVLVNVGPAASDTSEYADVAYSIPTGPAERLVYAYAQNFGDSNDLQVFGFNDSTRVNITSMTASRKSRNLHDFTIGPGFNESALGDEATPWKNGTEDGDVWWGSGVWDGELLRIQSDRPVTVLNGDYDKPHFGAFVPYVQTTPRLAPVAKGKFVGDGRIGLGETVTYDGSDSFDQDAIEGNVTPTYEWDLNTDFDSDGDGDPANDVDATGKRVKYSYSLPGTKTIKLTFTDDDGQFDSNTIEAQLEVGNVAPTVEAGPDRTITENESVDLEATVTDPDVLDSHRATIDWGGVARPERAVVRNGSISDSHFYKDDGTYTVEVCVTDEAGEKDCDSFVVTVENAPPIVDAGSNRTIEPGEGVQLGPATFTDRGVLDSHNATVDWDDGTGTEAGLVSEAGPTGAVTVGSHGYPDPGNYTVTVTVVDDDGASGQDSFVVRVNESEEELDVLADNSSVTVPEGDTATNSGTVTGVGSAEVSLSASVGTVSMEGSGTWNWSYETSDGPDDSQSVTITATTDAGATASATFDLQVENVPPSVTTDAETVVVDEGETATITGTVVDPGNDTITLSASVGTIRKTDDGSWNWAFDTSDGPDESQTVTITAIDDEGATDETSFDLTVRNVPPSVTPESDSVTVDEGQTATNTGTVTDPGNDTVNLSVSAGTITKEDDGSWAWSFETEDGPDDSQEVVVNATDEDGDSTETTFDLTVNNVPPTVSADADEVTVDEGDVATNTGTYSDPGADEVTLSASVGSVTKHDDGSWNWSFETIDGPDQSQTVTITAEDDDGGINQTVFDLTVRNVPPTVSATGDEINESESATVTGTFSDPGTVDTHTAEIDWGDGTVEAIEVDQTNRSLTASHVYGDDGNYSVNVTVMDDDGGAGSNTIVVSVSNLAPNLTLNTSGAVTFDDSEFFLGRVNQSQSHSANATDPGSDDLTFEWSWGATSTYFNDGSGPDPDPSPDGEFPFLAADTVSLTFEEPGVETVGITVTDDDGGSDAASLPKVITGNASGTRTIGFWRHQYSGNGQPHYSEAERSAFLAIVNHVSGVFSESQNATTFDEAFETLQTRGPSMREKAEAQALAAWLDLAAGGVGWEEMIDVDGDGEADRSFADIMTEVESILSDADATDQELERAKDLAEAINTHNPEDGADDGDDDGGTDGEDGSGDDDGGTGNGNGNGKGNDTGKGR